MTFSADTIVIGGGLVGSAIAFGLQRKGMKTLLLDQGDQAFRAARGNFGLVWVQGKGSDFPPYAQWTQLSAKLWQNLTDEILDLTRINMHYSRPGGLEICLDEEDVETRIKKLERLKSHQTDFSFEFLGQNTLRDMLPEIGTDVVGAIYSPADGHVNPLYLLQGLHSAFQQLGGVTINGQSAINIKKNSDYYEVCTDTSSYFGHQIILAAGLGNKNLGAELDLQVPIQPIRGQIIVTEKLKTFFPFSATQIRQSEEGSFLIGVSHEDVGMDDGTDPSIIQSISQRATKIFPRLSSAQVVRVWGALRVMSPDGYPIYQESRTYPGIFSASCHSGVTLAAAHVYKLAEALVKGKLPHSLKSMNAERFNNEAS